MPPNGYLQGSGGGIEKAGGAVAINDMLLMSFEGFLRFFPVWPPADDARFTTLRAVGAFLVSAALDDGVVHGIEVVSEAGGNCTILSPWSPPEAAPMVTTATGAQVAVEHVDGPPGVPVLWRFATSVGGVYTIAPHTR